MGLREFISGIVAKQKLFGTDFQGWLGNGLQEIQQAAHPTIDQVGMGTNATLGTVTSGEVTIERTQDEREPAQE